MKIANRMPEFPRSRSQNLAGRPVLRTSQLSVNVSGLDEPPSVTITTGTAVAVPIWGGIVTVQVVWSGQLTEAVWPPTVALI